MEHLQRNCRIEQQRPQANTTPVSHRVVAQSGEAVQQCYCQYAEHTVDNGANFIAVDQFQHSISYVNL